MVNICLARSVGRSVTLLPNRKVGLGTFGRRERRRPPSLSSLSSSRERRAGGGRARRAAGAAAAAGGDNARRTGDGRDGDGQSRTTDHCASERGERDGRTGGGACKPRNSTVECRIRAGREGPTRVRERDISPGWTECMYTRKRRKLQRTPKTRRRKLTRYILRGWAMRSQSVRCDIVD